MEESSLVHGSVVIVLSSLSYSSGDKVTKENVLASMFGLVGVGKECVQLQEESGGSGGRGGGHSCAGPEQGHGPSENPPQYQYHHRRYQDA